MQQPADGGAGAAGAPATPQAPDDATPAGVSPRPQSGEGWAGVRPDQVWVSDSTSIRLPSGFVYVAMMMDVLPCLIRGWQLGQAVDPSLTLLALALAQYTPAIHHADHGVQYAATASTQALEEAGVQISMAEVGAAWQHGHAERLIRTMKEEEGPWAEYVDDADAVRQIGRFLNEVDRHKRSHSALGYLTPAALAEQWHRAQLQTLVDHSAGLRACPILRVHFIRPSTR